MTRTPTPSLDLVPVAGADETDPTLIIIRQLLHNTNIMNTALAEAKTLRTVLAESDLKTKRLADGTVSEIRKLTAAVQDMTASQAAIKRAKSHNLYWGAGGFVAGMTILEIGLLVWEHMFG